MNFVKDYCIGDIISGFSIIFVIVGGLFGYFKWKESVKIRRAEYLNSLTEKLRSDKDIANTILVLDYGIKWYNKDFHGGSKMEQKIDKTLSYFSYICYLYKHKIIKEQEFVFFKYEVDRILMNRQVINYLYNLYHFSKKLSLPFTFQFLFEYGKSNGFFNKSFFDSKSRRYKHHLNF